MQTQETSVDLQAKRPSFGMQNEVRPRRMKKTQGTKRSRSTRKSRKDQAKKPKVAHRHGYERDREWLCEFDKHMGGRAECVFYLTEEDLVGFMNGEQHDCYVGDPSFVEVPECWKRLCNMPLASVVRLKPSGQLFCVLALPFIEKGVPTGPAGEGYKATVPLMCINRDALYMKLIVATLKSVMEEYRVRTQRCALLKLLRTMVYGNRDWMDRNSYIGPEWVKVLNGVWPKPQRLGGPWFIYTERNDDVDSGNLCGFSICQHMTNGRAVVRQALEAFCVGTPDFLDPHQSINTLGTCLEWLTHFFHFQDEGSPGFGVRLDAATYHPNTYGETVTYHPRLVTAPQSKFPELANEFFHTIVTDQGESECKTKLGSVGCNPKEGRFACKAMHPEAVSFSTHPEVVARFFLKATSQELLQSLFPAAEVVPSSLSMQFGGAWWLVDLDVVINSWGMGHMIYPQSKMIGDLWQLVVGYTGEIIVHERDLIVNEVATSVAAVKKAVALGRHPYSSHLLLAGSSDHSELSGRSSSTGDHTKSPSGSEDTHSKLCGHYSVLRVPLIGKDHFAIFYSLRSDTFDRQWRHSTPRLSHNYMQQILTRATWNYDIKCVGAVKMDEGERCL